jgi:hypothetical protein
MRPLRIAANGYQPDVAVPAMRLPEQVSCLAVSDVCHRTGIQDIDIGFLHGVHQLISGRGKLPGQGFGFRLIQLAAQCV